MFYVFFWNRWVMETQTTTVGKGQRTWLRIAMLIGSTPANQGRILPEKLQLQWPRLRSFSGTPIRSTPTSCSTMPSRSCIYHIPAHISNSILQKYNMSLVTMRTLKSLSNSTLNKHCLIENFCSALSQTWPCMLEKPCLHILACA